MNALDAAADQLARIGASEADEAAHDLLAESVRRGVTPAGIGRVYEAIGSGKIAPLTVPAFNVRGLVYDVARAIYRRASALGTIGVIFELAPSESATGDQSFAQYAALVAAAAAREGHSGPVFVQGDHFALETSERAERDALLGLARDALEAGYLQIDLDTAALAVPGATPHERQLPSALATAELLRELAPFARPGTVFGGEIGEIGGENTSGEDLQAFIDLVREHAGEAAGLFGKVSVQTGTRHGGMTGSDGSPARMPLDTDLAARLAAVARSNGFGGVVQHGASTLQPDQFRALPGCGIIEVHLATNIQNLIFDSPAFPASLRARMRDDALASAAGAAERGADSGATDPEAAFRQKRWSMWGPYKRDLLDLPAATRRELAEGVADWAEGLLEAFGQRGRAAELLALYGDR